LAATSADAGFNSKPSNRKLLANWGLARWPWAAGNATRSSRPLPISQKSSCTWAMTRSKRRRNSPRKPQRQRNPIRCLIVTPGPS